MQLQKSLEQWILRIFTCATARKLPLFQCKSFVDRTRVLVGCPIKQISSTSRDGDSHL